MLQAKLVKASLGLHKFLRTTPLIQAMNIKKVETLIDCQSLKLLKGIMFNDSKSKDFYLHLIRTNFAGNTLLMRVKNVCDKTDLKSICTVLFNDVNTQNCIKKLKSAPANDGVVDSCRTLLHNYDNANKEILRLLLTPSF